MNRDIAQGEWKQIKGKIRQQWGRLTDDEVEQIGGKYDRLVGKIQEKYGSAKDEVAGQVNQFLDKIEAAQEDLKRKPPKTS